MPCVICYSVTWEVYSYLTIEIPEPTHILPKAFKDGQTDCVHMGMNLLSSCPLEVIALPCLTNSYLKDQQALVAQILLKWHLLVSACNERHAGISRLPSNDRVGGTCVSGYSSVLPILEEISVWWGKGVFAAAHILLLQVSWASVLEATLLERGDGIQNAPWEILSVDGVASTECELLSKLWADVLNRLHLKDISLRQRSSKTHAELVSQL